MGGVSIAWTENDPKIAEGNAKFFGPRIVGKFIATNHVGQGAKKYTNYTVQLYADFNDVSKFGQDPDGEVVTLWGSTVLNNAFERGYDGTGIKPGDIIEVIYKGLRKPVSGGDSYYDYTLNAFTPSPAFKPTAPAAAPAAPTPAAPAKNDALDQLGYN